jgi:hypothetical protein
MGKLAFLAPKSSLLKGKQAQELKLCQHEILHVLPRATAKYLDLGRFRQRGVYPCLFPLSLAFTVALRGIRLRAGYF